MKIIDYSHESELPRPKTHYCQVEKPSTKVYGVRIPERYLRNIGFTKGDKLPVYSDNFKNFYGLLSIQTYGNSAFICFPKLMQDKEDFFVGCDVEIVFDEVMCKISINRLYQWPEKIELLLLLERRGKHLEISIPYNIFHVMGYSGGTTLLITDQEKGIDNAKISEVISLKRMVSKEEKRIVRITSFLESCILKQRGFVHVQLEDTVIRLLSIYQR